MRTFYGLLSFMCSSTAIAILGLALVACGARNSSAMFQTPGPTGEVEYEDCTGTCSGDCDRLTEQCKVNSTTNKCANYCVRCYVETVFVNDKCSSCKPGNCQKVKKKAGVE
jgi:hypothetical protein